MKILKKMLNLKSKTVCVYDDGMFSYIAERLSRDFARILLYTEWKSDYPRAQDDYIGVGLPGVERISDFWDAVDNEDIDLFVFPGIYHGDVQEHLVSLGRRVWGSRHGDELERYRCEANTLISKLGLPSADIKRVVGMDALRKHLMKEDDKYIKISNYRADTETFHHQTYDLTAPRLDELEHKLGMQSKVYEFIVEDPIKGNVIEAGYDGYSIDGQYPDKTLFGYEHKDCGWLGKVKPYDTISPLVTDFNAAISPWLRKRQYRNFFHTECRIKGKVSTMIDACCRFGAPPAEVYTEMCTNLAEIMWFGAVGELIQPEFEGKYGIELMINSDFAQNKWQTIYFPDKIRRWIKLRNHCIIEGVDCVIPKYPDFDNVGAVCAVGNTVQEAIDNVKKYAEQIKGYGIEIKTSSIPKLQEIIQKGKDMNLQF